MDISIWLDIQQQNIKDASTSVNTKITPIEGLMLILLIKKYPYFAKANVPGGLYTGNDETIPTFGVKAVLVTSDDVSVNAVYTVVKAILENFDEFKQLHPAYSEITKSLYLKDYQLPLHEGAKKYFKKLDYYII